MDGEVPFHMGWSRRIGSSEPDPSELHIGGEVRARGQAGDWR